MIRLNSYMLPEPVIEKMINKIQETKEKRLEVGFGLCRLKNTNIIRAGGSCTGTECEITQPRECLTGSYVGGFHTHPMTDADPSIADLLNAYVNDVECIGSAIDSNIKCFVRIGPFVQKDKEDMDDLSKSVEFPGRLYTTEEYQKWKNARDEIMNKHFQEVDFKEKGAI